MSLAARTVVNNTRFLAPVLESAREVTEAQAVAEVDVVCEQTVTETVDERTIATVDVHGVKHAMSKRTLSKTETEGSDGYSDSRTYLESATSYLTQTDAAFT